MVRGWWSARLGPLECSPLESCPSLLPAPWNQKENRTATGDEEGDEEADEEAALRSRSHTAAAWSYLAVSQCH